MFHFRYIKVVSEPSTVSQGGTVAMVGDWSHFKVEEHGVKALQADQELCRNIAGDSFDRRSECQRWSAHRRIHSPPPSHRPNC
ncbi:hypothetical protein Q3G72_024165 [Acer saccharum]|nr:hypothetical protein Q3G72_024165 [Acer saccharum]